MAFNDWFAQAPDKTVGYFKGMQQRAHVMGRTEWAKSFARGGMAYTVFAPTRKEMLKSPFRRKLSVGSEEYMKRLQKMKTLPGANVKGINKAIADAEKGAARGIGGKLFGGALMAGFIALPAFTTEGDAAEKARAVTSGAAGFAGWTVGAKAGGGIGAVAGSFIPILGQIGVGQAIGGLVGAVVGGVIGSTAAHELTDALTRIPDRMVAGERARRGSDWGMHTAAFQTQKAHTMRQQSLSLMNRGQMSARSLMGREAMYVHT